MENCKIERKKNLLTITVDLSVAGKPSTSGKSLLIASSSGSAPIPAEAGDSAEMFVGINVFKYVKAKK
jgi:hypothetical protein